MHPYDKNDFTQMLHCSLFVVAGCTVVFVFLLLQKPLSEEDVVKSLPTKDQTLDVMTITDVLSQRGTNELGNFEMQYAYHPVFIAAVDR